MSFNSTRMKWRINTNGQGVLLYYTYAPIPNYSISSLSFFLIVRMIIIKKTFTLWIVV